ncbi:MAG: phage head closure protein [Burkholderiales bacterium]|nr:phage head closure protein [Burkholderiales bacterium]
MVRAGQFNTRVTVQRQTAAEDAWGQPLPAGWETHVTLWASVRHLSGAEAIKSGADVSIVAASIRIRWREDITAGMRAVCGARVYDIEAVLPGPRREYVDLTTKQVQ